MIILYTEIVLNKYINKNLSKIVTSYIPLISSRWVYDIYYNKWVRTY